MEIKNLDKIKKIVIKKLAWVRIIVFLALLIYCGYLWYTAIYIGQLDAGKKQSYMDTKEKEVEFNQGGFEAVLGMVERRKASRNASVENVPDIFRLR